jgi:hypothetical protein
MGAAKLILLFIPALFNPMMAPDEVFDFKNITKK